ncbi:phage tail protein [Roseateles sp.]|uniref:phage tail protein n=1 Tax=Roseateles sp. TaxID=1971397 RepID=UPI0025FFAC31|nr:tail fiber protein [Roseateles sp.]MBV8037263.1 phage tail protein [Roseateles sp.]
MSTPFIAEIRVMPYNFAPQGWAQCDGQLMPISQNTALFSLLGTYYGGDGRSTFRLPDLGGRFAMSSGQGPGLSMRMVGDSVGQSSVSLIASEMPVHGHGLMAGVTPASTSPAGNVMAPTAAGGGSVYRAPGAAAPMAGVAISAAGAGLPHENRQPYLALNFCIALQGIFPPRS